MSGVARNEPRVLVVGVTGFVLFPVINVELKHLLFVDDVEVLMP